MVSDFLAGMTDQIQQKYPSNDQGNIYNVATQGNSPNYSTLGDYGQQFDRNYQRRYMEAGYIQLDPFNVVPELYETLMQEPDATVLIKKRAFSSMAENYRPDVMDADEKLYLRATKVLFQNKCNQISAMEKLTKIARVTAAVGQIDDLLMPLIIDLVDNATNNFASYSAPGSALPPSNNVMNVGGGDPTSFQQLSSIVNKIRKVVSYSPSNTYTTWIPNLANPFQSTLGQGTGVIELTNVSSIKTTTTVDFSGGGNVSLSIEDPYSLMRVTEADIDWALNDALNFVANQKLFQQGQISLQDITANNTQQLNAARTSRGVSQIQFISNANTITGNLVTAVFASGNQITYTYNPTAGLFQAAANSGVSIGAESLIGGPNVGNDGLNPSEAALFATTIISIYQALNYTQSAASTVFTNPTGKSGLDVNYVRNKLRFHYGNKLVAQPMDRIHIYLGSKSRTDNQVMSGISGLFSGLGYLQNPDNIAFNIKDQWTSLFNPSSNIDLQLEKQAFVGLDFPNGLWALMRNTFINDKSGCHVFGGVITESSQSRTPGKYTVSIGGKDNTHFLDFGITNLDPGVDNFSGPLYDPLTPYKTRFDVVTTNFKDQNPELLDENKVLFASQTYQKGLIKYKSGRYAGQPATLNSFRQDSQITKDGSIRSVIHGPNGLVYKWKEGIGTFTYNADSYSATDPERIGIPAITNDPFAGQDIMNTISLLIAGVPYNYATYFKAVSEFDQTARDPQTGQDPAVSFYNALSTTLQKNDTIWGDFVPFKNLVMDPASYQAMAINQVRIQDQNNVINNQLTTIQNLQNQIFIAQAAAAATQVPAGSTTTGTPSVVQTNIQSLQTQLADNKTKLNKQINLQQGNINATIPTSNTGADTLYSASSSSSQTLNISDPQVNAEQRRLTNLLTRRLSWAVRANEDKNLLIVDDSYDKDYDILAYEKLLKGSVAQFNSVYNTVREKVSNVASLLNLEVFCDSQGHIRVRPQQYNKIPSSVFFRMLQMKLLNGIQIFPQFLQDLYLNQIQSLLTSLEVLELQIRLDGAYIGIADDSDLEDYLSGGFTFFSQPIAGDILGIDSILTNSNPDQIITNIPAAFVVQTQKQSQLSSVFNSVTRAQRAGDLVTAPGIVTIQTQTYITQLITSIKNKSGQQVPLDNFLVASATGGVTNPTSIVDVVKVNQDLSDKVNQRQQLIKTLASVINNAKEFKSLDSNPNNITNILSAPPSYGNNKIPAVFQHMIEDELFDDYGPGSGSRYVIRSYQIIQLDVSENPPDFTALEVQGQLDPFIDNNSLPFGSGSGKAFPQRGNATITAAAIDYDLWRMYGFRTPASVAAPFLSQPETQCAPYAVSILMRSRKEILQGSCTIAGNEFMQPGEVVYIEELGLLFYVTAVSHNFTFGSKFTTQLTLKYGHNPGEYIPTPTDIIGKVLYANRDIAGYVNYRQTTVFNETPVGAIVIQLPPSGAGSSTANSNSTNPSPYTLLTSGNYGSNNLTVISNLLNSAVSSLATNNAMTSNVNVQVELRIFYDSSVSAINDTLGSVRSSLRSVLVGTTQVPNSTLSNTTAKLTIPAASINLANVDIHAMGETRSPSQRACDQARNIINATQGLQSSSNPLYTAMSQCVIDCVLVFNPVDNTANSMTTNTSSNTVPNTSASGPAGSDSSTNVLSDNQSTAAPASSSSSSQVA